ncbi:hypothetical protein QAD02_009019 [Eretmocerus hayati]|uniref:Uncharacterized protein n=1 Tax=Eretmocerus hayati TaxID=131215 RepID=A0ACC2N8G2_9HYME|nr:hypothetical protein QAD02_009019 [Eretmocerus hayati]
MEPALALRRRRRRWGQMRSCRCSARSTSNVAPNVQQQQQQRLLRRRQQLQRHQRFLQRQLQRLQQERLQKLKELQEERRRNLSSRRGLNDLPPEMLEMVLRFLSYDDIAKHVRLVSKKFCWVSTTLLNSGLLSAGTRLHGVMRLLEERIRQAKDPLTKRLHSRARDSLELVLAQYELLRACVWRYTHPPRNQNFARLTFYAGSILDEIDQFVSKARQKPEELHDKDTRPAESVTAFGLICKKFMNFFEKVSERKVNRNQVVSGCKSIDLLDCLLDGRELLDLKTRELREYNNGSGGGVRVSMRLRYVLRRAWFTCCDVPGGGPQGEDSWRERQRFMYLRLRRLVASCNEHHLENLHYERELADYAEDRMRMSAPKPPPCSTYSGYGEYGGRFYYYGNMNEYAFDYKVMDAWRKNRARDSTPTRDSDRKPCYDLIINVELKCSPELAPLAVRPMLKCDDFENNNSANNHRPELYMKLTISCPASASDRIPSNFVWEVRSPRYLKTYSKNS